LNFKSTTDVEDNRLSGGEDIQRGRSVSSSEHQNVFVVSNPVLVVRIRILNNKSNRKEDTFFLCPISQRYTLVHLEFSIKVDRYKKQEDGRMCNYSDVTA